MTRAVALLSGGLDSTLACKLMLDQGIEIYAVNFITPFCTCTKKGCKLEAKRVAENFDIPLKVIYVGEEYIQLVKNPPHGYGSNMNPCIDCRIFMFSRAKVYMEEIGASFIVTGEVLGERPMSQRLDAMRIIEKESGLCGKILRPLSAKWLPPTIPELEGLVDRNKLLKIKGRSRKPQMKLAEELGIDDYPCPAGGCRLTDPNFARRIRDAFEHEEDSLRDIKLLKLGRHFRLPSGAKVVIGRDEQENKSIIALASGTDILLEVCDVPGPIGLLKNGRNPEDIPTAASICLRYSDFGGMESKVSYWKAENGHKRHIEVAKAGVKFLEKYRI